MTLTVKIIISFVILFVIPVVIFAVRMRDSMMSHIWRNHMVSSGRIRTMEDGSSGIFVKRKFSNAFRIMESIARDYGDGESAATLGRFCYFLESGNGDGDALLPFSVFVQALKGSLATLNMFDTEEDAYAVYSRVCGGDDKGFMAWMREIRTFLDDYNLCI